MNIKDSQKNLSITYHLFYQRFERGVCQGIQAHESLCQDRAAVASSALTRQSVRPHDFLNWVFYLLDERGGKEGVFEFGVIEKGA